MKNTMTKLFNWLFKPRYAPLVNPRDLYDADRLIQYNLGRVRKRNTGKLF